MPPSKRTAKTKSLWRADCPGYSAEKLAIAGGLVADLSAQNNLKYPK